MIPGSSEEMHGPRGRARGFSVAIVATAIAVGSAQVVVGAIWWIVNLSAVPPYGDTPEYLRLAESLEVDKYRTLAYPVLVRAALRLAAHTPVPWQVWLYVPQTALAGAAAWYLLRTLLPHSRKALIGFSAAIVVTSPLVLHYATSVLTDSAATSLFVVTLAGAARIVARRDVRWSTWVLTAASALGASLMRPEKAIVILSCAAIIAFVLVVLRIRGPNSRSWRPVIAIALTLAMPAVVASGANRVTQTGDEGRTEGGVITAAVSRVVWPHLADVYDELPPEVKAEVSREDALAFDENNNAVLPMIGRLRELDGGRDRYTTTTIRLALACCGAQVVAATLLDAVEYTVSPVTLMLEGTPYVINRSPTVSATTWNLSRMSTEAPTLSAILLVVNFVLMLVLATAAVAGWSGRRRSRSLRTDTVVATILFGGTVLNGLIFAAAGGADANLRYSLSNIMVVMGILNAWSFGAPSAPGTNDEPHEVSTDGSTGHALSRST